MDDDRFQEAINERCETVRATTKAKGFETSIENLPEKIALIHSEASEVLEDVVLEDYRKRREDHIDEELADIVIRVMDLAAGIDADLGQALVDKIEDNQQREDQHGGRKI